MTLIILKNVRYELGAASGVWTIKPSPAARGL